MKNSKAQLALVTGANSGMGWEVADALLGKGFDLVIWCRTEQKAEAASARLSKRHPMSNINTAWGDFSDLLRVDVEAHRVAKAFPRIDVLVAAAGGWSDPLEYDVHGLERTILGNHLGVFHLINVLFSNVASSPQGKIVVFASGIQQMGSYSPGDLRRKPSGSVKAYANSKLMNIMFTYALHRRHAATGVRINCLHPGMVNTPFWYRAKGLTRLFARFFVPLFARNPKKGAETAIWLATSLDAVRFNGSYLKDKAPIRSIAASYDTALQDALWAESENLVEELLKP
jgi:NAD(P)-dependent dehydrogenase (short-subunit alcohol dehydrogenase family)